MLSDINNLTVSEAILARQSIRSYTGRLIDQDVIGILLEAAVHAPTAIHQEPWGFVIIQDSHLLKRLSDYAKPRFIEEFKLHAPEKAEGLKATFGNPDFNIFYDAGTLIIIYGKKTCPFYYADCWLAAENLMLAACAMQLGTCVIGSALSTLEATENKAQLGIPKEYSAVAPIIVGYPLSKEAATRRQTPLILANFANPFDNNQLLQ